MSSCALRPPIAQEPLCIESSLCCLRARLIVLNPFSVVWLQKPDNLLMDGSFDGQGGVPIVKVADFGLSKHKWKSYVSGVRDLR